MAATTVFAALLLGSALQPGGAQMREGAQRIYFEAWNVGTVRHLVAQHRHHASHLSLSLQPPQLTMRLFRLAEPTRCLGAGKLQSGT